MAILQSCHTIAARAQKVRKQTKTSKKAKEMFTNRRKSAKTIGMPPLARMLAIPQWAISGCLYSLSLSISFEIFCSVRDPTAANGRRNTCNPRTSARWPFCHLVACEMQATQTCSCYRWTMGLVVNNNNHNNNIVRSVFSASGPKCEGLSACWLGHPRGLLKHCWGML